eukprot:11015416-Prorocentrum_lima.AAC.1
MGGVTFGGCSGRGWLGGRGVVVVTSVLGLCCKVVVVVVGRGVGSGKNLSGLGCMLAKMSVAGRIPEVCVVGGVLSRCIVPLGS